MPNANISYNSKPIVCVVKNTSDGAQDENIMIASNNINDKLLDDIVYVKLGDTIEFSLDKTPDNNSITVYDRILNEDGTDKYATKVISSRSIQLNKRQRNLQLMLI